MGFQTILDLYTLTAWTGVCIKPGLLGKILDWMIFLIRGAILGSIIANYKKQDKGQDEFQPSLDEKD